jgi:hypothetical protein
MADQYRKDQSGGNQATGKTAKPIPSRTASPAGQTDNGTGAGTAYTPLKPVPSTK